MKKITCLVCFLLILLAVGCIKYDQVLTLNKDGSGTVTLHYAMSDAILEQMKAMEAMKEGMSESGEVKTETKEDGPFSMEAMEFNEEKVKNEFKELKKDGFQLKNLKTYGKEGWQHVELEFTFKDVSNLKKVSFFKTSNMAVVKNDRGNYEIRSVSKKDDAKEGEQPPGEETAEAGADDMMGALFGGLYMSYTFNTPTEIVDTNAPEKKNTMARWVFDFDKDPSFVKDKEGPQFVIEFKGKGVKLNELKQD